MHAPTNGTKKWLVAVLTAVGLAFGGWLGATVTDLNAKIQVNANEINNIKPWMQRIEDKLDKVLSR